MQHKKMKAFIMTIMGLTTMTAHAENDSAAEIAKKLNNPIANMTSVPFQGNFDQNMGVNNNGEKYYMNIQPVIPFSINNDWNMISRTIFPLIHQTNLIPGTSQEGNGDTTQSLFFSPKAPTADGWIWGVGPAFLLPTASDAKYLGSEKWGVGPTAVVLKQKDGWTYGALVNHISSFAGEDKRENVSATYMQPFLSYTTHTYTTFSINTESTYNWKADDASNAWSVPINVAAAQLFKVGKQPMQLQLGARYWEESPDGGAEGWGLRLAYTLVFLK